MRFRISPGTRRHLVVEIAIVVVGILIALGLDQLVGTVHDLSVAQATGKTIRAEVEQNLGMIQYRLDEQACVDRRLDEIDDLLNRWGQGEDISPGLWVGRPTLMLVSRERWEAAVNAGRVSMFPQEAQAQAGAAYAGFAEIAEAEQAEQMAWAQLRGLERGSRVLTDAARPAIVAAVQTARYKAYVINGHATSLINGARRNGVIGKRPTLGVGKRRPVCVAMHTPRAAALAAIARPTEEPR